MRGPFCMPPLAWPANGMARGASDGRGGAALRTQGSRARDFDVCESGVAVSLGGRRAAVYHATGKMTDVFDIRELDQGPFRDSALRDAVAL